jgi:hypothetical protein
MTNQVQGRLARKLTLNARFGAMGTDSSQHRALSHNLTMLKYYTGAMEELWPTILQLASDKFQLWLEENNITHTSKIFVDGNRFYIDIDRIRNRIVVSSTQELFTAELFIKVIETENHVVSIINSEE